MNRMVAISTGVGLAAWLAWGAIVEAQHNHGRPPSQARAAVDGAPDERRTLGLGPAAEGGLKLTMREHLEAIQAIVSALGREEFERAAAVAHEELGFPKHHQAMEREAGATFPARYHELAMAHHREAEDLAAVIPSHDLKTILRQLDKTIGACVACHRAFKL